jgi:hypothetical protein
MAGTNEFSQQLAVNHDREQWSRLRQLTHAGKTRRFRRFTVVLWIMMLAATLAFDLFLLHRLSHSFSVFTRAVELLVVTATQLFITWLAFRSMRIGLAQPAMDDSAAMQFGVDFDLLNPNQRNDLVEQRLHELLSGRVRRDEREAELRQRAESAAYHVLRLLLPTAIVAYWAIIVLGPFANVRGTLTITAIAFTWIAVTILALPTMARMWTQPDDIGEPKLVEDD